MGSTGRHRRDCSGREEVQEGRVEGSQADEDAQRLLTNRIREIAFAFAEIDELQKRRN